MSLCDLNMLRLIRVMSADEKAQAVNLFFKL